MSRPGPVEVLTASLDGAIHLRWVLSPHIGFPTYGFDVFRRKSRLQCGQVLLGSPLGASPLMPGQLDQLTSAYATERRMHLPWYSFPGGVFAASAGSLIIRSPELEQPPQSDVENGLVVPEEGLYLFLPSPSFQVRLRLLVTEPGTVVTHRTWFKGKLTNNCIETVEQAGAYERMISQDALDAVWVGAACGGDRPVCASVMYYIPADNRAGMWQKLTDTPIYLPIEGSLYYPNGGTPDEALQRAVKRLDKGWGRLLGYEHPGDAELAHFKGDELDEHREAFEQLQEQLERMFVPAEKRLWLAGALADAMGKIDYRPIPVGSISPAPMKYGGARGGGGGWSAEDPGKSAEKSMGQHQSTGDKGTIKSDQFRLDFADLLSLLALDPDMARLLGLYFKDDVLSKNGDSRFDYMVKGDWRAAAHAGGSGAGGDYCWSASFWGPGQKITGKRELMLQWPAGVNPPAPSGFGSMEQLRRAMPRLEVQGLAGSVATDSGGALVITPEANAAGQDGVGSMGVVQCVLSMPWRSVKLELESESGVLVHYWDHGILWGQPDYAKLQGGAINPSPFSNNPVGSDADATQGPLWKAEASHVAAGPGRRTVELWSNGVKVGERSNSEQSAGNRLTIDGTYHGGIIAFTIMAAGPVRVLAVQLYPGEFRRMFNAVAYWVSKDKEALWPYPPLAMDCEAVPWMVDSVLPGLGGTKARKAAVKLGWPHVRSMAMCWPQDGTERAYPVRFHIYRTRVTEQADEAVSYAPLVEIPEGWVSVTEQTPLVVSMQTISNPSDESGHDDSGRAAYQYLDSGQNEHGLEVRTAYRYAVVGEDLFGRQRVVAQSALVKVEPEYIIPRPVSITAELVEAAILLTTPNSADELPEGMGEGPVNWQDPALGDGRSHGEQQQPGNADKPVKQQAGLRVSWIWPKSAFQLFPEIKQFQILFSPHSPGFVTGRIIWAKIIKQGLMERFQLWIDGEITNGTWRNLLLRVEGLQLRVINSQALTVKERYPGGESTLGQLEQVRATLDVELDGFSPRSNEEILEIIRGRRFWIEVNPSVDLHAAESWPVQPADDVWRKTITLDDFPEGVHVIPNEILDTTPESELDFDSWGGSSSSSEEGQGKFPGGFMDQLGNQNAETELLADSIPDWKQGRVFSHLIPWSELSAYKPHYPDTMFTWWVSVAPVVPPSLSNSHHERYGEAGSPAQLAVVEPWSIASPTITWCNGSRLDGQEIIASEADSSDMCQVKLHWTYPGVSGQRSWQPGQEIKELEGAMARAVVLSQLSFDVFRASESAISEAWHSVLLHHMDRAPFEFQVAEPEVYGLLKEMGFVLDGRHDHTNWCELFPEKWKLKRATALAQRDARLQRFEAGSVTGDDKLVPSQDQELTFYKVAGPLKQFEYEDALPAAFRKERYYWYIRVLGDGNPTAGACSNLAGPVSVPWRVRLTRPVFRSVTAPANRMVMLIWDVVGLKEWEALPPGKEVLEARETVLTWFASLLKTKDFEPSMRGKLQPGVSQKRWPFVEHRVGSLIRETDGKPASIITPEDQVTALANAFQLDTTQAQRLQQMLNENKKKPDNQLLNLIDLILEHLYDYPRISQVKYEVFRTTEHNRTYSASLMEKVAETNVPFYLDGDLDVREYYYTVRMVYEDLSHGSRVKSFCALSVELNVLLQLS